ncbi:Fic family protein [Candidatus Calescamantes bacterium]|nr:Fic family protein [Candidatus Calescamantes bacterium]
MFKPKFNYTHDIVNNLLEITSAREIILNAYLVPKWEVSLRKEALIRATHASTAIEGNPLTLEEVSKLAQGRKVTTTRRAKQEVLNYLNVLEHIEKYQEKGKIEEKHILNLHRDITKETLEDPEWEGKYRKIQVYVGNRITGEVIFVPPPPEKVPPLMKSFLQWLNSRESFKLHPVLVAGISHYEFVRIHPFVDGNGRTARALATLILYIRGFDIKRFFALDDYYDSDRIAYYNALKSVDQNTLDLTGWLEYFTEGVKISILRVKEKVLQLSIEKGRQRKKGQIALTDRQMEIIEFIQRNGKITAGDVADMFKITRQAALKELSKLVKLEVIALKGKGRGAHYVLV